MPDNFHQITSVRVPLPLRTPRQRFRSALPDLVREVSAQPVAPETYGFLANVDAQRVEQILNIPERERKPDIHV